MKAMKKIIYAIIICSLALFTSCGNSVVGKWHCVKLKINGEKISNSDCKDEYGFGLSVYSEIDFNDKGMGMLYLRENGERALLFDYSEDDDNEYDIDIEKNDYNIKNGTLKVIDDKLELSIKVDNSKIVITYEKGESDEKFNPYTGKAGLKNMNRNAELIYYTIANECTDIIRQGGDISQIKIGKLGPIKTRDLDTNNLIQQKVKTVLNDCFIDDGYISWETNGFDIVWVQWSIDKKGIVGQFPDPETDINAEHTIGKKF